MANYRAPTNDPFDAERRRREAAERAAREALTAGGTQPFQAVRKLTAALAELDAQAQELLVHAGLLDTHTGEIAGNTANITALLQRLANAGIVDSDEFWGHRDAGASSWWSGAKPTVSVTTLSGKLRVVYGGAQMGPSEPSGDGNSRITFAVNGSRMSGDPYVISARDWPLVQREKFISVDEGATVTLTLEWQWTLFAGWISVQPLL